MEGIDSATVDAANATSHAAFIDVLAYDGTFSRCIFLEGDVLGVGGFFNNVTTFNAGTVWYKEGEDEGGREWAVSGENTLLLDGNVEKIRQMS
jgi:hypothetical protein